MPDFNIPKADPFPGKPKHSESGGVDGDANVDDNPDKPGEPKAPPEPEEFPLTRSEYDDLHNIRQILEKNLEDGGNLMPAMQNAFRLSGDDAVLAYLDAIPQEDIEDEYS